MRKQKIIIFKTSSSLGNPRIKNRTILPNNYHYLTNNFQPKKPKQHKTWQSFVLCPIPHTATAKRGKKTKEEGNAMENLKVLFVQEQMHKGK
jgi:hypothetical protein